jgi:HAMP domain-containing protein
VLALVTSVESLALLAICWLVLKSASTPPPRWHAGRRLLAAFAAVALQAVLFIAVPKAVEGLFVQGVVAEERVGSAGLVIWATQAARAALLLLALWLWTQAASAPAATEPAGARPHRRWSRPVLAAVIGLAIELVQLWKTGWSSVAALLLLALLAYVAPRGWMGEIRGVRRLLAVPLALFALIASQDYTVGFAPDPGLNAPSIASTQEPLVVGEGVAVIEPYLEAAAPFTVATRAIGNIFALQGLFAFLRLPFPRRVLPAMSLRNMSLERRLAMTYVLVRILPQMIVIFIVASAAYFLLALRASSEVKDAFEATLSQAQLAADRIVASAPESLDAAGREHAAQLVAGAQPWLGPDSLRAHVVLRWIAAGALPESLRAGAVAVPATADDLAATRGTPEALLSLVALPSGERKAWRGLVESGGALYLLATARSARAVAAEPGRPAPVAQVFVALDSLYLSRVAGQVRATVRLEGRPSTYVTRTARQISITRGDSPWTKHPIDVTAPDPGGGASRGFFDRSRYFAQELLPTGDWTQPIASRGAVRMRLETSLRRAVAALPDGLVATLITIGTPFVIVAIITLVVTEGLAVRAGRGIAASILSDVRTLSDAVRRIGEGNLDHRVPVSGKDELAQLAAAFNDMTASLKRHQAELLEKERIEADLAVARDIQMRLLPQEAPRVPGLDVAGLSIPSREVGGDLFCFLTLEGGRLGVALGDVSGKSVPAALLMSNVLASLKVHSRHGAAVHSSLEGINRLLCDDILFGKFVTLFYGIVDTAGGSIRYASAGHNPPLVVSASGAVGWLREAWVPLGIQPDAAYKEASAPLVPGDVLVIYSDGVTEADTLAPSRPSPSRRRTRRTRGPTSSARNGSRTPSARSGTARPRKSSRGSSMRCARSPPALPRRTTSRSSS